MKPFKIILKNKGNLSVVALVIIILLCISLFAKDLMRKTLSYNYLWRQITISKIRDFTLLEIPALKTAKNNWQKAILLRNYVYSHSSVGPQKYEPVPLTLSKMKEINSGQSKLVCDGMAVYYIGLLQAFNIKSRIVYLATNKAVKTKKFFDAHATVEVFLKNKWVIQDPTFNIHWDLNGMPLSSAELRQAFKSNEHPKPLSDGMKVFPNRSVQNYYLPYKDLMDHVEIDSFNAFWPNPGSQSVITYFPDKLLPWRFNAWTNDLLSLENIKHKSKEIFSTNFNQSLQGWEDLTKQKKALANYTLFKTHKMNTYQLISPSLNLSPGNYFLILDGSIRKGGIQIGLLDHTRNIWLNNMTYKYYQNQFSKQTKNKMIICFSIASPLKIKIILSNWSYNQSASLWKLRSIQILNRI